MNLPHGFALAVPGDPQQAYAAGRAVGDWLNAIYGLLECSRNGLSTITSAADSIDRLIEQWPDAALPTRQANALRRIASSLRHAAADLRPSIQSLERK